MTLHIHFKIIDGAGIYSAGRALTKIESKIFCPGVVRENRFDFVIL